MNGTPWTPTVVRPLALAAILAAATGCLQLDLAIEMRHDGGATVTERLRLSGELLELDRNMARHLKREAAAERMSRMGKGMSLESHTEGRIEDGSLESVAVYRIPAIEDLRLPNPFVQENRPAPMMRFEFKPIYESPTRPRDVGNVGIRLTPAASRAGSAGGKEQPSAGTPLGLQGYRHLEPVFAHLMRDFAVKVSLTVPDQPAWHRRPAGSQTIRLLSFTGADLDRYAAPFLENEEALLALLQFKLSDPAILTHTTVFPLYGQVPVHRGGSPYGSTSFQIKPTRSLFQKYFAGRPKSQGGDQ